MTLSHEVVNAVAQLSAERMADSLVIGMALAAFAWLLLRLLPRQNSATRFAVWFAALLATAVLPWLSFGAKGAGVVARIAPAPHALISVPGSWAVYLFAAWVAITALALARLTVGMWELRRIRRQCQAIEWNDEVQRNAASRLCPSRRVEILSSQGVQVPTAIGFFRPAIVIPAGLLDQLTAAELNHLLLHEMAHLRRWDDWTNLVQKVIKSVLFFHPAVWWVEQRLSLEREMACDDAVLAETSSPRAYAECLASLAEKSFLRRSAALAQAAVSRIRQTSLRVAQILDANRPKAAPVRKSAVALVGAFACACAAVAWQAPQLIAFSDQSRAVVPARSAAPVPESPTSAKSRQMWGTKTVQVAEVRTSRRRAKPALPRRSNEPVQMASAEPSRPARRPSQVIEAKVSTRPMLTTGVVVIIVNDPVFGPTPILYHFAVWQVPTPQHATETGLPRKQI